MSAEPILKSTSVLGRPVRSATLPRSPSAGAKSSAEDRAADGTSGVTPEAALHTRPSNVEARRVQAENELAAAREAAFKDARAEGLAKAAEEIARFKDGMRAHLAGLFANIERAYQDQLRASEGAAIDIAFAALCRIFGEGHADRAMASAAVNQVLSSVPLTSAGTIHVRTTDLPILQELFAHPDMSAWTEWKLIADPSVRAGGCIVRTARGDFDGRIETQLEEIAAVLKHARAVTGRNSGVSGGSR